MDRSLGGGSHRRSYAQLPCTQAPLALEKGGVGRISAAVSLPLTTPLDSRLD